MRRFSIGELLLGVVVGTFLFNVSKPATVTMETIEKGYKGVIDDVYGGFENEPSPNIGSPDPLWPWEGDIEDRSDS